MLVTLVDDRQPGYAEHAQAVARLTRMVGLQLGLDSAALERLRLAALLHDVGCLRLPFPHTGSRWYLPPEERRVHEGHPQGGAQIIRMLDLPAEVEHAVLGHHERVNGTGYPGGLAGPRISLGARILGVCDAYDSVVGGRAEVDAQRLTEDEAFEHLRQAEGERFDQTVVHSLSDALEEEREIGALTGMRA
jgi:putative nucleotidyltransferase with HDIG domain